MKAMERLSDYLRDRPEQLRKLKEGGTKIVGYFASNYVPEEIIYASGAVPICLAHGGNSLASNAALSVTPQFLCPFARAQIGEKQLKNPYYNMLDVLVAPMSCIHLKKVTEIWEYYYDDAEIFRLGIPYEYSGETGLEYYAERLKALKDKLQILTGNEITDDRLREAIDLYNRVRELLKKISLMRKAPAPAINASDFIRLNQASLLADPVFMVNILDSAYQELNQKQQTSEPGMPRLLLTGPNIGYGDYKVLNLVEEVGAKIVMEEVCEGIRYYWQGIENKGDLIESLAKGYLRDRLPCAFMDSSTKTRLDFMMNLTDEFNISGVIWYQLLYCETYDAESYYFARQMEERKIPVLVIDSDYSMADIGQVKTRIEAFIEILRGEIE